MWSNREEAEDLTLYIDARQNACYSTLEQWLEQFIIVAQDTRHREKETYHKVIDDLTQKAGFSTEPAVKALATELYSFFDHDMQTTMWQKVEKRMQQVYKMEYDAQENFMCRVYEGEDIPEMLEHRMKYVTAEFLGPEKYTSVPAKHRRRPPRHTRGGAAYELEEAPEIHKIEQEIDKNEKSLETPFQEVFLSNDIAPEYRREVKDMLIHAVEASKDHGIDNPFQRGGECQEFIRDNWADNRNRARGFTPHGERRPPPFRGPSWGSRGDVPHPSNIQGLREPKADASDDAIREWDSNPRNIEIMNGDCTECGPNTHKQKECENIWNVHLYSRLMLLWKTQSAEELITNWEILREKNREKRERYLRERDRDRDRGR